MADPIFDKWKNSQETSMGQASPLPDDPSAEKKAQDDVFNRWASTPGIGQQVDQQITATNPQIIADGAKRGFSMILGLPGIPFDVANNAAKYNLFTGYGLFNEPDKSGISGDNWEDDLIPVGMGSVMSFSEDQMSYQGYLDNNPALGEQDFFGVPVKYPARVAEFGASSVLPAAKLVQGTKGIIGKSLVGSGEVASATGGGLGMEGGGDLAEAWFGPDGRPTGELIGSLLALTPYALPTFAQAAINRSQALARRLTGNEATDTPVLNMLQKELSSIDNLAEELERSQELISNIPGLHLTLGEQSGSTGLLTIEEGLARRSEAHLQRRIKKEKESWAAIDRKLDDTFPKDNFNVKTAPANRLKVIDRKLSKDALDIETQITIFENRIKANKGNPEDIGLRLSVLRDEAMEIARAKKNAKYTIFYKEAEKAGITIQPSQIKEFAGKILTDDAQTYAKKSPVLKKIYDKYVNPGDVETSLILPGSMRTDPSKFDVSMEEFHSMLKETSRELRVLKKGDPSLVDQSLVKQLTDMKGFFKSNLAALKESQKGSATVKALEDADKYFLNEYRNVFERGVGGRIKQQGRYGEVTEPEDIVTKLVLGRESGIKDFNNIYGQSQEAHNLLNDGIMDAFYRVAIKHGEYNPSGAKTFIDKHQDALDKLPELKKALSDESTAHDLLTARQEVLKQKRINLHQSRLAGLTGAANTDELFTKALRSPEGIRLLRTTAAKTGGEGGLNSFRHDLSRYVLNQKNPAAFVLANKQALTSGFGAEHMAVITDISDAVVKMEKSGIIKRIDTSLVPQDQWKKKYGVSLQEGATLGRHTASGFLSPMYTIPHAGGKMYAQIKKNKLNDLLEEALYDPEIGKAIHKGIIKEQALPQEQFFKLTDRLYSMGFKGVVVNEDYKKNPSPDFIKDKAKSAYDWAIGP